MGDELRRGQFGSIRVLVLIVLSLIVRLVVVLLSEFTSLKVLFSKFPLFCQRGEGDSYS